MSRPCRRWILWGWLLLGGVGFTTFKSVEAAVAPRAQEEGVRVDTHALLRKLDREIGRLTDLRNKALAKAARAQDQGDRLQFQSNNQLEAGRAWKQADIHREHAARYQADIEELEGRRRALLRSLSP